MTEAEHSQTDNVASPPKADEDLSWSEFFREMENDYNEQSKTGGAESKAAVQKKKPPRKKRKKKKKKTTGCFG